MWRLPRLRLHATSSLCRCVGYPHGRGAGAGRRGKDGGSTERRPLSATPFAPLIGSTSGTFTATTPACRTLCRRA
eukprot:549660-Lingulodinium_polyedra.AAC.1